ncbi:MAG: hypothetical protein ACI8QT_002127 [Halioglobus sp.]|jgi:hypothetical protein
METLDNLMKRQLSPGGVAIPCGRELHMEVIETQTGLVWMSVEAVTQQDFDNLELGDTLRGVGIATAGMDAALFLHSPNATGEPVRERIIGGHRFINVAIPGEATPLPGGMIELMVNKAHVVGYAAGRTLVILSMTGGDFVELVGDAELDHELTLPDGARLRTIELKEPWVVPLPNPTKTLWRFGENLRSFQGPVSLPDGV